jgi:protein-arginine kinase activator protein McsA
MTHCRVCGVLTDVGESVICEDCADRSSALEKALIQSFSIEAIMAELKRRKGYKEYPLLKDEVCHLVRGKRTTVMLNGPLRILVVEDA